MTVTLNSGDRVRLNRKDGGEGVVKGQETADGQAYVRLDQGSAGNFPVEELTLLPAESKAWPPAGIETK